MTARTRPSAARSRTVVRTRYPRSNSWATHHDPTNLVPPVTSTVSFMTTPRLLANRLTNSIRRRDPQSGRPGRGDPPRRADGGPDPVRAPGLRRHVAAGHRGRDGGGQ